MKNEIEHRNEQKSLSVVLTVHDQAPELRKNLPLLLEQQYENGYEVIVVDESSSDDTGDVLKQLSAKYPHLYSTYIPASSHYISRRKLALTIGMKAAKNEWVILTEADCHPDCENWLEAMAETMTEDVDAVCGYTAYEKGTKSRYTLLRMITFWRQGRKPWRYDGANLAIRKSAFMQRNGFLKNLQYLRSEYDFLINETAPDRLSVIKTPESRMRQTEPTAKTWTNLQLYYMQTRSQLSRTCIPRLRFAIHQLLLHLSYWMAIAAIVLATLRENTIWLVAAILFLLLLVGARTFFIYRLTKKYGEQIALWKIPLLDVGLVWHYAYYRLRYLLASKYDFTRK